jgi:hypothetical protein
VQGQLAVGTPRRIGDQEFGDLTPRLTQCVWFDLSEARRRLIHAPGSRTGHGIRVGSEPERVFTTAALV